MTARWLTVLLLAVSPLATAQFVDPHNVLIENVHIVTSEAGEALGLVNILIRDNKLELVSQDKIPAPDGVLAVDANGGYLIGKLNPKGVPSFIILDEDPEGNFDVFMDTAAHIVFAVDSGELRKNTLTYAAGALEEKPEDQTVARGWFAYTPPPMAVPTDFGTGRFNQWETEHTINAFLAAVVLDRQHWPSQNADSEQQVGDLGFFEGGEIRGLRVGAVGAFDHFGKPWTYTVFGATHAFDKGFEVERSDDFTWFDYRLDIPLTDRMGLSVGKQKEPISMERLISMVHLPMQERAAVSDAILPSRNFGVVLNGNLPDQRVTWAGGLFHNFIDADSSLGSTPTQLIGRVTWVPFVSADESNLLHLGGGIRLSNTKQGVQAFTEPEFNKSPVFVDTGLFQADDSSTINLEASWRRGPYWVHGEYTRTRVTSAVAGDPDFSGYHLTGSWIITGEMRSYNFRNGLFRQVPVAQSVYQGGWGALEASVRLSRVDLTDGLIDGGEMDIASFGINWWLSPRFNVNLNYRFVTNDRDGLEGEAQGLLGRVMLVLE